MGDLKPLGSEKLKADDKLKRILELTYYNNQHKPSSVNRAEHLSESNNGVYGIVREKDGYYVKKGLNENTLDYIGGMFMKNKNKFTSYAEALKRLELLKGQETLQEAETKYVLKTSNPTPAAPQAEAPMAAPTTDAAPAPAPMDMPPSPADAAAAMPEALPPSDDAAAEMGPDADMGQEGAPEDYLKMIQKLTGKLGQRLRAAKEDMESDDIKYVINSVVSALNIDKLEPTDKEEILSKFEDEDEYMGDEMPSPEMGDEMQAPTSPEDELGETMDKLDSLVSAPAIGEGEDEEYASNLDYDGETRKKYQKDYLDRGTHENPFEERPIRPGGPEDEFFRNRYNGFNDFTADFEYDDDEDEYGDMFKFDIKEEDPEMSDEPEINNEPKHKEIEDRPIVPGGPEDEFFRNSENGFDTYGSDFEYDDDEDEYGDMFKFDIKEEDPEMGDSDTSVHNPERYDTDVREIELSELTNMINQTVKETLGKYFNK